MMTLQGDTVQPRMTQNQCKQRTSQLLAFSLGTKYSNGLDSNNANNVLMMQEQLGQQQCRQNPCCDTAMA